jgi:hypothetical protein
MVHWNSISKLLQYHCQFMPNAVTDVKKCKFYSISAHRISTFSFSFRKSLNRCRNGRISNGNLRDRSSGLGKYPHSTKMATGKLTQANFSHIFHNLFALNSFFEEGATAPPPFNIIPTPKSVMYFFQWLRRKFFGQSKAIKKEHMKTIRVR